MKALGNVFRESHWAGKYSGETELMCDWTGKDDRGVSMWLQLS